ncbi:hypothetical protein JW960_19165 [candidate division KSB1 bacterium]|nr:hypothetical protein [candidate division KSB1 bacterium]
MNTVTCQSCNHHYEKSLLTCPFCGTPTLLKSGTGFEWKSATEVLGFPFIHIAFGKDANGKRRIARGIIAIGQFGIGVICIAQIGIGLLFGFGQVMLGFSAIAQVAIAAYLGIGQLATGYIAIGQLAFGYYVLAQVGYGKFIWSTQFKDFEAVEFFKDLAHRIGF